MSPLPPKTFCEDHTRRLCAVEGNLSAIREDTTKTAVHVENILEHTKDIQCKISAITDKISKQDLTIHDLEKEIDIQKTHKQKWATFYITVGTAVTTFLCTKIVMAFMGN
jgi:hypothetical protein